ncbi:type II toxin-antitoxin system HipA family toxin [Frondihabitans australicus]|uniref:Serine/threonine-protein kinase HipA n=1 Tax=Frondihabitans australicus TaxID=386892 RepID=A0A495IFM7_9MICO|nr:type II toxin-antitoxin system HipA family toxin [Frondihabitans australicus]RKR73866.1 serine/threonine-protein kinase HipA [Frondihabitans australicus]
MPYTPVAAVEVTAWGLRVGAVAPDPGLGSYVFEYYPDWVARGIELAPLHMPISRRRHVFPSLPEATFHRLPALLADALPDDFGNAIIDAWLARQGIRQGDVTPLDRLAYMSNRAMGALEFRPSRGPRQRVASAVEMSALVEGARSVLDERFAGDRETEAAIHSLIQVGTSAGGARAKAVIAWNPDSGEIRSGQLPADPGFEFWLIKLDGVGRDAELGSGGDYGRVEYAYAQMARAAGLEMTETRLLEENGRAHFMTRRYDRGEGGSKVHALTLCGLTHLDFRQRQTHDYSQYFQAIASLGLGASAREQAFRRMVFNVLAANCDDHTKNFSFLLDGPGAPGGPGAVSASDEGAGAWRLAPAYDVTFAYNPGGAWTYQHLMSVNGRFRDITLGDIEAVADRHLVPRARAVVDEVRSAVAGWRGFASDAGVAPSLARDMAAAMPRL